MELTSFNVEFAGIPIHISNVSSWLRDFCAGYITERQHVFSVSVSEEDIAAEAVMAESGATETLCEIAALHRKISEEMPKYGRFLVHGAAITYGDDAYLFCAPSGTGKSTHISLWKKYLGHGVDIINGDKPFLSLENGGTEECVRVHGSPWAGKELWQKNRSAPLRGICIISRGGENAIRRLDAAECIDALMRQIYIPQDTKSAEATLTLTDSLLRTVPVYRLWCDMSEDAVKCSFEALTGLKYQAYGKVGCAVGRICHNNSKSPC